MCRVVMYAWRFSWSCLGVCDRGLICHLRFVFLLCVCLLWLLFVVVADAAAAAVCWFACLWLFCVLCLMVCVVSCFVL